MSAGSADIGFISGGNYVLFSDDCDVLLTALRYAINKDSEDPKDWNDGTIEENTDQDMSTYYRSIILAGPSEKGQELLAKVNNGEELTWDDLNSATWAVHGADLRVRLHLSVPVAAGALRKNHRRSGQCSSV